MFILPIDMKIADSVTDWLFVLSMLPPSIL